MESANRGDFRNVRTGSGSVACPRITVQAKATQLCFPEERPFEFSMTAPWLPKE